MAFRKGPVHAGVNAIIELLMAISRASSREHNAPMGPLRTRLEPELRKVELLDGVPAVRDVTVGGFPDHEHVPVEFFDGWGHAAAGHPHGPTGARVIGRAQSCRSRCTARYEHSEEPRSWEQCVTRDFHSNTLGWQ